MAWLSDSTEAFGFDTKFCWHMVLSQAPFHSRGCGAVASSAEPRISVRNHVVLNRIICATRMSERLRPGRAGQSCWQVGHGEHPAAPAPQTGDVNRLLLPRIPGACSGQVALVPDTRRLADRSFGVCPDIRVCPSREMLFHGKACFGRSCGPVALAGGSTEKHDDGNWLLAERLSGEGSGLVAQVSMFSEASRLDTKL